MSRSSPVRLSRAEILEVLAHAPFCRLAVAGGDRPYLVPMHYLWKYERGRLSFVLFSRPYGEKMAGMYRNPHVALELETEQDGVLRTVVARGRILRMGNPPAGMDKCYRAIEIFAKAVSGRAFLCHANEE